MTQRTNIDEIPTPVTAAGPAACAAWDQFISGDRFRLTTRSVYRSLARRFLYWLEAQGTGLVQVTPYTVEAFLGHLNVLETSKVGYRASLRCFFDALIANGVIHGNPAALARLRPSAPVSGEPGADDAASFEEQFAHFTPVERQATVDAAAFALALHDIQGFTGVRSVSVDVSRCEDVLELGHRYGLASQLGDDPDEEGAGDTRTGDSQPQEDQL